MSDSISCVCGYRGPSVPEGDYQVCPLCRGRVRGFAGSWSLPTADDAEPESAPQADEDDLRPAEPTIYRIPCPRGHVLKAREDMLGEQVCCPECNEFFVLRATDSVEFRRQQAQRRAVAEERAARAWMNRAIWAAALVVLSLVAMLVIALQAGR